MPGIRRSDASEKHLFVSICQIRHAIRHGAKKKEGGGEKKCIAIEIVENYYVSALITWRRREESFFGSGGDRCVWIGRGLNGSWQIQSIARGQIVGRMTGPAKRAISLSWGGGYRQIRAR